MPTDHPNPQSASGSETKQLHAFIQILKNFIIKYNSAGNEALAMWCFIAQDIIDQQYRYFNAYPGEVIKLDSYVCERNKSFLAIVKDDAGDFEIIFQLQYGELMQIHLDCHLNSIEDFYLKHSSPWHPITALNRRINYLKTKVPAHLQTIKDLDVNHLFRNVIMYQYTLETLTSPIFKFYNYELYIIKNEVVFQLLLKKSDGSYVRIDCLEEIIYQYSDLAEKVIEQNLNALLERASEAELSLESSNTVPALLSPYINALDLLEIYDFILRSSDFLETIKFGGNHRFSKESTSLKKTFYIQKNIKGEYMLLLMPGKKVNPALQIFKKVDTSVKECFRIDTMIPQVWVVKLIKQFERNSKMSILHAVRESIYSQYLLVGEPLKGRHNITVHGSAYIGTKPNLKSKSKKPAIKMCQFSPKHMGSLFDLLYKIKPKICLTEEDKTNFIEMLAFSLEDLALRGMVHGDFHSANIFFDVDENGKYYLTLGDYGLAYRKYIPYHINAAVTRKYESPEIRKAYLNYSAKHELTYIYEHYYALPQEKLNKSYAYNCLPKPPELQPDPKDRVYTLPDSANDMWSFGIVCCEILHGNLPTYSDETERNLIRNDPFLGGLLEVERDKRYTIKKAIYMLYLSLGQLDAARQYAPEDQVEEHYQVEKVELRALTVQFKEFTLQRRKTQKANVPKLAPPANNSGTKKKVQANCTLL